MGSNASSPTNFIFRRTPVLAILGAALAFGATPAMAEPTAPSMTVTYADLDLGSPGDAKLMLKRLTKAATAVCGGDPNVSAVLPRMMAWQKKCVGDAIDRSLTAIDAPLVAQLYAGETPVAASLAAR